MNSQEAAQSHNAQPFQPKKQILVSRECYPFLKGWENITTEQLLCSQQIINCPLRSNRELDGDQ
jgi:hypothetical protein